MYINAYDSLRSAQRLSWSSPLMLACQVVQCSIPYFCCGPPSVSMRMLRTHCTKPNQLIAFVLLVSKHDLTGGNSALCLLFMKMVSACHGTARSSAGRSSHLRSAAAPWHCLGTSCTSAGHPCRSGPEAPAATHEAPQSHAMPCQANMAAALFRLLAPTSRTRQSGQSMVETGAHCLRKRVCWQALTVASYQSRALPHSTGAKRGTSTTVQSGLSVI